LNLMAFNGSIQLEWFYDSIILSNKY